jgi:hypothetical protein
VLTFDASQAVPGAAGAGAGVTDAQPGTYGAGGDAGITDIYSTAGGGTYMCCLTGQPHVHRLSGPLQSTARCNSA